MHPAHIKKVIDNVMARIAYKRYLRLLYILALQGVIRK